MPITTILFDLDGTLLPMDQDAFAKAYVMGLAGTAAGRLLWSTSHGLKSRHQRKQIKKHPEGSFFYLFMGFEKDIWGILRMKSNSYRNSNQPQCGYLYFFTIHYYLLPNRQASREE
ncbi:MAG: hypothetical protein IKL89_03255 [Clostridia bacterium]|nr:hypothetical protein [Clostridia bacterium]